ncbi:MAG: D-amino-acid transaminase [Nitrospirae bacterium]|nr:D-amino-acid transaminase [Nitrospirota bacterium]
MPNIAFVNGRFMPLAQARVSVEDRGFQFGDGIYELIRTYGGRVFHIEDHLRRLEQSAEALGLSMVYSKSRWKAILEKAHGRSGYPDAKLYIQITRGAAPRDHSFPKKTRPSVIITVRKLTPLSDQLHEKGASVITVPDLRWGRCDIKSVNLLPNIMAREKARSAGAFEALFVRDGLVLEGAGSNVFAVIQGRIVTPPNGPFILSGITRDLAIGLAREARDPVIEKGIPLEELLGAEEVFLTGTTTEILPIVKVDGKPIGDGRPGRTTRRLYQQFLQTIRP